MDPHVLAKNLGYAAVIFQDVAIMMGLGLFMSGLFRLKRYAEMRTFMSHQMTISAPLLMIIGGILLLALPLTLRSALYNVWSTSNPLHYGGSTNGSWQQLIPPIVIFVRLIGVGAFMRGIVLFARSGSEQSPPGTMSKAMLHVIGGLLCVHILGTFKLLNGILGITGI